MAKINPSRIWGGGALSDDERSAFIRLVAAEAPSSDADAQRNVGSVIFNRMYGKGVGFHSVATRSQFEAISNKSVNKISPQKYAQTERNLAPMLYGNMGDTTNGADHYLSPSAQVKLAKKDNRTIMPNWASDPSKITKKDLAGHWFYRLGSYATGADKPSIKTNKGYDLASGFLNDAPEIVTQDIPVSPEYKKRVDNIMRAVQPKGMSVDMDAVIKNNLAEYLKNPAPTINNLGINPSSTMSDFMKLYGLTNDPQGVTSGNIQNDPYQQSINGVNTLKNVMGIETLKQ